MNTLKPSKEVLSNLLKQQADNPDLFAWIADIYIQLGKLKSARKLLTEGVKDFPDYAVGWIVKGNLHMIMKDRKSALESFNRALEINSDIPYAHERCCELASERKDSESYFKHISAMIKLDPMNGFLQKTYQAELLRRIALGKGILTDEELDDFTISELRLLLLNKGLLPDQLQRQGRLEVAALFKTHIPELERDEPLKETKATIKTDARIDLDQIEALEQTEVDEPPSATDVIYEKFEPPLEEEPVTENDQQTTQDDELIEAITEVENTVPTRIDLEVKERLAKIVSEVIGVENQITAPKDGLTVKRVPTETLGELYVRQARWEDAIEVFRSLLENDPVNEKYRLRLQAIYNRKFADEGH